MANFEELGHFIKHKPLISEECQAKKPHSGSINKRERGNVCSENRTEQLRQVLL